MKWVKRLSLAFFALVLVVFALMGVLYATRGTPTREVFSFSDPLGPPAITDTTFLGNIELLTKTELAGGHTVDLLFNGNGTYPRLWQDLRAARHTITLQLYYCMPGMLADSLKHVLIDRARAGVRTLVLFDAFGAQDITDEYKDSLRSVGIRVADFRPLRWHALHKAQHRSHIRVVVIDDTVGYTGGFGIADMWQGDGHSKEQWRDTNVRFTGPAVQQLQAAFSGAWTEATGELLTGHSATHISDATNAGGTVAGLMHAEPAIGSTVAERFLALTLVGARKTLFITNAYFVPDDDFRRMLRDAARRGVDVRVLTAGKETDVKTVRLAARRRYDEMLRDGVQIYEYRPTMVHAKTIVADGIWSTIGTMNFDNRSLALNDESNLLVYDTAVGGALQRQFLDDLRFSDRIDLRTFEGRSVFTKALERMASVIAKIL